MGRMTATENKNINDYERKWKIKTNINKFKIIAIGKRNKADIMIDDKIYSYANEGTVL